MPMFRSVLLLSCALAVCTALAETTPSYKGLMRLPIDLYTADGIRLEKGRYELEVRRDRGHPELVFLVNGKVNAIANGRVPQGDPFQLPATRPLVGTHYLRSSAEPVRTAQERQYSKTGRAQYEEESRDWKASLRVYRAPDSSDVFFVFWERQRSGRWTRVDFGLSSMATNGKP